MVITINDFMQVVLGIPGMIAVSRYIYSYSVSAFSRNKSSVDDTGLSIMFLIDGTRFDHLWIKNGQF